jgi:hypothetical protein
MLTNCPLGNKETHACWECFFSRTRMLDDKYIMGYECTHPDYKETMKVKPRKIETVFCEECGKNVKFKIDWEGVVSPTRKGIITYKELYAYCPKCDNEVYIPAIGGINEYRREKAYKELPDANSLEVQKGIEDLIAVFVERER